MPLLLNISFSFAMDESIQDRDALRWIEKGESTCDDYEGVAHSDGNICCDPNCEKCGGSGCGAGRLGDLCCGVVHKIFDVCGLNATKAPCRLIRSLDRRYACLDKDGNTCEGCLYQGGSCKKPVCWYVDSWVSGTRSKQCFKNARCYTSNGSPGERPNGGTWCPGISSLLYDSLAFTLHVFKSFPI